MADGFTLHIGDKYDIHDNEGCTMYFGDKKKEPVNENEEYAEFEEIAAVKNPAMVHEDCDNTELSRIERIRIGIKAVKESGKAIFDYYYVAIYKVILDKNILDTLSLVNFESILSNSGLFEDDDYPKANNMKAISIKGKYPDWMVSGKKYNVTSDLVEVARIFLKAYGK